MTDRREVLPLSLPPRGLNREQAARYVGVSPNTFDKLVVDGIMPRHKQLRGKRVWDRHALDLAFDAIDNDEPPQEPNPWDG